MLENLYLFIFADKNKTLSENFKPLFINNELSKIVVHPENSGLDRKTL